ncbi:Clp protease ClpP [Saccharicrinis fermentans]|uniref:Clp protease ClpP n=1 Tax=Saccharicrinis fermentans TaxID=982 RepID=UPI0004B900F3|nr:Clp protease ClpP [Saccharicrinis fermentans]
MFKVEKLADKAVLTIYGYVGGYYMDYRNVAAAIEEVKQTGYNKLDFRMHTYGGSVFDGNLIYNFLSGFDGELNIYIDGVAASMGFIIMLAAPVENVHIAENGLGMCHSPSGGANGTAKDLEQAANLLRLLEKNFKAVLKERTGKTDDEIESWFDGSDYWFDADQLIEMRLVGSKFKPKENIQSLDTDTASAIGARATYERFAALTTTQKTQLNSKAEMNKAEMITRYDLTSVTAESTDEEILAAIDAKMQAKDDAAKAERKKAIVAAVDVAIAAGKITKEQKSDYVARGEKLGLDDLNGIFADMQKADSIISHIKGDKAGLPSSSAERKAWTWDDYQSKAPGDLEAMAETDPEQFKALYKAEYGVEPEV